MKISCSHCELSKASENIRDSMCDHTICGDCRSHGHNNAMTCPKCGLAKAKPCLHQFSPVPGSSRFSHCGLCGQLRVDDVMHAQEGNSKVHRCDHCGSEKHYAPNGICVSCSVAGHSMFGGCSKCAAKLAKALDPDTLKEAESAKAEIKAAKFGYSGLSELYEAYKAHTELQKKVEASLSESLAAPSISDFAKEFFGSYKVVEKPKEEKEHADPAMENQVQKGLAALTNHIKELEEKGMVPKQVVNTNQQTPEWEWEQVVQKAVNKCAKVETVFCVHCQKGFEVQGDIKTWDVVYTVCIDCYRNGHRGLPRPLGHCDECPQVPAFGAPEPEPKNPEKKPGRNLMI